MQHRKLQIKHALGTVQGIKPRKQSNRLWRNKV